jgi:hypothetical protein
MVKGKPIVAPILQRCRTTSGRKEIPVGPTAGGVAYSSGVYVVRQHEIQCGARLAANLLTSHVIENTGPHIVVLPVITYFTSYLRFMS